MKFETRYFTDKNGNTIELRNAGKQDAEDLLRYLKVTTSETPFLIREPEEVTLTLEEEEAFIENALRSEKELLLVAYQGDQHIGNCSIMSIGSYKRYRHRCSVGIALYQEFCGRGIGRAMLKALLEAASQAGYEQAELEVFSENKRAIALYESLGFKQHGLLPNNMKYKDGTYADALWMAKKL